MKLYIVTCSKGEWDSYVKFNVAWTLSEAEATQLVSRLEEELSRVEAAHTSWLVLNPVPYDKIWTDEAAGWHEARAAEVERIFETVSPFFAASVDKYDLNYSGWSGRPNFAVESDLPPVTQ